MRVLFICGAVADNGTCRTASWIESLITLIDSQFEIIIASTSIPFNHHPITAQLKEKEIQIYPIANCSFDELKQFFKSVKVNVVVVFGTEGDATLPVLETCRISGILQNTVVFAQGICCACAKHYAEGVPGRIIKRYTFRDILRRQNICREQKKLERRAAFEKRALLMMRHFIGRTTMDHAILRSYNTAAAYYECNDVLRSSFYEGQWTYESCEKHRIFVSQYYYPLKGFHYLLEAVAQLKDKYPDITIAAAGYNPIQKPLPKKEIKDSSYIRYIKFLIKKYDLSDHIELLGELSEEQMKEEYLKANAFVMPSTIENSPNSLAEAMILGVPTIASDVGGVTDFAKHNEEAFIYPSSATYLLAHYIDEVFSDRRKAEFLGEKGKKRAEFEYNYKRNISKLEKVFKEVAGE